MPFRLNEDSHENGAIVITPRHEGAHRILGLIEGRDFEAQVFVLNEPTYQHLFDMSNYSVEENIVEKLFLIRLKESNLEVDVYGKMHDSIM